jgi:hypothetical protein
VYVLEYVHVYMYHIAILPYLLEYVHVYHGTV